MKHRRLPAPVDWLFRDRHTGPIVVAKLPDLALWVTLATSGRLAPRGRCSGGGQ